VLADLVETVLVPKVIARGYEVQGCFYNDPENRTIANEIHLERHSDDIAVGITFSFAKYGRPKFQVRLRKRQIVEPREHLLHGNLVSRPSQYYHWWGKPWWLPNVLWSDKRAENVIKVVAEKLSGAFDFLDTGIRNSNISRRI
jgi:hypothetical protein